MNRDEPNAAASNCGLQIGGAKGHEVETIDGAILRLFLSRRWKPIPRCTGRYTCRDHALSRLHPVDLARQCWDSEDRKDGSDILHQDPKDHGRIRCWSFDLPGRTDRIVVVPLDDTHRTGIISYRKDNASFVEDRSDVNFSGGDADPGEREPLYVHTLNAPSGFRRKLEAMGLTVTDDDIRGEAEAKEP